MKRTNEKGITLIALIITIIVMLILVGVTVNMAVQEGLFKKAGEAARGTNKAIEEEKLLAEGIIGGKTIDEWVAGAPVSDDWYGNVDEEEDLQPEQDGKYHIRTCLDLAKFAEMVNSGNTFEGQTVVLEQNLDLKGHVSNKKWTPIGINEGNYFSGIFDGKNHYIKEIYCNENGEYAGLFGYVKEAQLKNLGIESGRIYTSNGSYAGGIVGYAVGITNNKVQINNCYNKADIGTDDYSVLGGIIGEGDYIEIERCYNLGVVDSVGGNGVGGIAGGLNFSSIKSCYNEGRIAGYNDFGYPSTGGLVGWNEEGNLIIENSYNIGEIEGSNRTGGIVGTLAGDGNIKNCYNIGNIASSASIGEIAGYAGSSLVNCYFISGTNRTAVGESEPNITISATSKTEAEMKSENFVTLLNTDNESTIWKRDTKNINNGYPILSWQ